MKFNYHCEIDLLKVKQRNIIILYKDLSYKWRSPSLSGLTPIVFNMGLTHLGSEASK